MYTETRTIQLTITNSQLISSTETTKPYKMEIVIIREQYDDKQKVDHESQCKLITLMMSLEKEYEKANSYHMEYMKYRFDQEFWSMMNRITYESFMDGHHRFIHKLRTYSNFHAECLVTEYEIKTLSRSVEYEMEVRGKCLDKDSGVYYIKMFESTDDNGVMCKCDDCVNNFLGVLWKECCPKDTDIVKYKENKNCILDIGRMGDDFIENGNHEYILDSEPFNNTKIEYSILVV